MKHKGLLFYSWLIRILMYFFPDIPIFMRLRGWLYSLGLKACGRNFQVAHSVVLNTIQNIEIGNDVYIAYNCVIIATGVITIEDEVIIGPNNVIVSSKHIFSKTSFRFAKSIGTYIKIGKGSWITSNCTIGDGVIFPARSILSACSMLSGHSCPNNEDSLYSGVPAIFIKKI